MKKVEHGGFVPESIRRRIQTMLLLRYNTLGCQVTMIGTEYKAFYNQELDPLTYGFSNWQIMLKSMPAYVTFSKSGGGTIIKSLPFDHSVAVEYANKLHPPDDVVPPTDQTSAADDVLNFMNQFIDDAANHTSNTRDKTETTDSQNQILLNQLSVETPPIDPELLDTVSSSSPDSPVLKISVGVGTESEETIEEVALRIVSIASIAGESTSNSTLDQTPANDSEPATIVDGASPITDEVQMNESVAGPSNNNIITANMDIGSIIKLEPVEYPEDLDRSHGNSGQEGISQAVPPVVNGISGPTAESAAPNINQHNDSLDSININVKIEPTDPLDETSENLPSSSGMNQPRSTSPPTNYTLTSDRWPVAYVKLERLDLDINPNLSLLDPGQNNNVADNYYNDADGNNTSNVEPAVNLMPATDNLNQDGEMELSARDHERMEAMAPDDEYMETAAQDNAQIETAAQDNAQIETAAQDNAQIETAADEEQEEEPPRQKKRRKSSSISLPGRASRRIASLKSTDKSGTASPSPPPLLEEQVPPKKRKTRKNTAKRSTPAFIVEEDSDSEDPIIKRDRLFALSLHMEENSSFDDIDYDLMFFKQQQGSQSLNTNVAAASTTEPIAGTSKTVIPAHHQQVEPSIIESVNPDQEPSFNQPMSQFVNEIIEAAGSTEVDPGAKCSPVEWFHSNKENEILSGDLHHFTHKISNGHSGTNHSYLDDYASGQSGFDVKELEQIRKKNNPKILFFHPFFNLLPQNRSVGVDEENDTGCIATDIMISSMSFDSIQIANVDASLNYELSNHFLTENGNRLLVISSYANYSDYFLWRNGLNATTLVLLDCDQDHNIHLPPRSPRANNCHVFHGDEDSVSIFDPATTRKFRTFVHTFREKVDVFIANAMGFQNMKYRPQDLTISQLLLACETLRSGGTFVIKLQDASTCLGIGLIFVMSQLFDNIALHKPESGLPGERFVICRSMRNGEYFERIKEFLRNCNESRIVESILPIGEETHRLFVKGHTIDYLRTQDSQFLQYIQKVNKAIGTKEVSECKEMEDNCKQVLVDGQIPAHIKQQIMNANEKKRNQMLISWNYQKKLKAEVVNNDQQVNNDDSLLVNIHNEPNINDDQSNQDDYQNNNEEITAQFWNSYMGTESNVLESREKSVVAATTARSITLGHPDQWKFIVSAGCKNRSLIIACENSENDKPVSYRWTKERTWKVIPDLQLPKGTVIFGEIFKSSDGTPVLNIIDAAMLGHKTIKSLGFEERYAACAEFAKEWDAPINMQFRVVCDGVKPLSKLSTVISGLAVNKNKFTMGSNSQNSFLQSLTTSGQHVEQQVQYNAHEILLIKTVTFSKLNNGNNARPSEFKFLLQNRFYWEWNPRSDLDKLVSDVRDSLNIDDILTLFGNLATYAKI